jgi:hypothetical protein
LGERVGIAETFEEFAYVAFHLSAVERAIRVWSAAKRLRNEIGAPRAPAERTRYDEQIAAVRAAVGRGTFDAIWRSGRAVTLEQAIEFALTGEKMS